MSASENHFGQELNKKEVIELLEDLSTTLGAFNKTIIIPLALVGYEIIESQ